MTKPVWSLECLDFEKSSYIDHRIPTLFVISISSLHLSTNIPPFHLEIGILPFHLKIRIDLPPSHLLWHQNGGLLINGTSLHYV